MVQYDIPVSDALQEALEPISCADLQLRLPKPLEITLPFGGSVKAFVDTSKGIPNDCSMTFNLMLQIAPLLAALECPMKILKLLEPLVDVIKGLPTPPVEAIKKFGDAAIDLAPCFAAFAGIPLMVMDLLRLIRAVLNCLLGQLRSVRNLMNGLALRLGEAEGRPELREQIECAQKNAAAQAAMLTSSIDPVAGVIGLMKTMLGIAGIDLDLDLDTGGVPPEDTEALDSVIAVLETAVQAIDAIVGE